MAIANKGNRQFRKIPLWNALFWFVLWLFSVWNNYQWANSAGNSFSWDIVFSWSFPYYMVMVLLGPVIYLLYGKWKSQSYPRQILKHLFPAILLGLVHQLALNVFFAIFSAAAKTTPQFSISELIQARYDIGFIFSINGFLFYWLCLGLIFLADLYQRHRQNERANMELQTALSKAKFETLQSQLQPHFLFNTFNSLAMMARQQKHKEVVNMIALVSNLLRETLSLGDQQQVPLDKELSLVNHYLDIEQVRFRDRLTVTQEIAEDTKAFQVPVLFLQPIVENAFQHGISKTETAAKLEIKTLIKESSLLISISNSGPTLPTDWKLESHLSIGLSNVLQRLDHAFGESYTLALSNLEDGSGVITKITLPIE
ncbi:MAG: histidine kinase [Roseivirga sp.]|nr:histidine kinase [Roseivirga sp.]